MQQQQQRQAAAELARNIAAGAEGEAGSDSAHDVLDAMRKRGARNETSSEAP